VKAEPAYEILFTDDAESDVRALDGSIKIQLRKILARKIAAAPDSFGIPLGGELSGYYSHHFAAHRLIYRIYKQEKLVVVCAVGSRRGVHASDVYQQFQTLAQTGRLADQVRTVLDSIEPPKRHPRTPPKKKN
jgi:mRNA-degrading endonuclease RelE of RelBE toxin-antitoxin system